MTATNDITGDLIKSKVLSKQGRDNWDRIFGKKPCDESLPSCKANKPNIMETNAKK